MLGKCIINYSLLLPLLIKDILINRFLEPMACREDEELEAYVSRLELAISQDLGINTTSFTAKDKVN